MEHTLKSRAGKLILLATTVASGMAFFDGSTTGVALPTLQRVFGASITQIQWIVSAFTLVLASFLLISGGLGDRFGRKKIFTYGIILFVIASAASALSKTVNQLVIFQAIQGLGAAMMIPGSLAIINSNFAHETRGKVIGLWAGYSGGIAAAGPFLGGWLVQTLGWPWVWWINVPLGIIALIITLKYVPESRNPDAKRLDWPGALFIALGLLGLAYGLMSAPALGWTDPKIIISLGGAVLSLIIFYAIERQSREPLVPLKIFKSPLVTGANWVTLLVYFALYGVIFFLVLNLQQIQGLSPVLAGAGMLPPILIITFLTGPAGGLSDRIGPRTQMILGPLLVGIGMAWIATAGVHVNYFTAFLPGQILFGLGMCLLIAPLTKSALSVEDKYSGAASGVNNAVSRIAAMLAIAVLGAVILSVFTTTLARNITNSNLAEQEQQTILQQTNRLGAINVPTTFSPADQTTADTIVKQSFAHAFRWIMGINAALALLAAGIAALTIKNPKKETA